MAIEPTTDPLERARQAARDEQPEGWIELSESVMSRVRALVTPSEPILAFTNTGNADHDRVGSKTRVSARIVTAALRRVLQQPTHAPEDIDLEILDERLGHINIKLVCSYDVDLVALAETVRNRVHHEVVSSILGPDPEFTPTTISIDIVDVVVGNPNFV